MTAHEQPHGDIHDEDAAGEQSITGDSPVGGDETTEDQLEADNPVEADQLKSLDPDDHPA